jgi:hypothetical protein
MKYSYPDYSAFTNPSNADENLNYYKGTIKAAARTGVPNYSAVLPSDTSGYVRKPLLNPYTAQIGNEPNGTAPGANGQHGTTTPGTTPTMPTTPGATPTRPTTPAMPSTPGATPSRPTMPTTPGATPTRPTTPSMPTMPTTPGATPTRPTTPSMPTMPTTPGATPTRPTTPSMPTMPTTPGATPTRPTTPSRPTMPTTPGATPNRPTTPSMPTMPTTPGATPNRPTTPSMPTMPTTPGATPNRPTTPAMPTMPTTPGATPNRPTTPSMPTMPTTPGTTPTGSTNPVMRTFPRTQEYPFMNYNDNYDYNDFTSNPNRMNMPDRDMYSYRVPMGVPMMPLYGYDNCDDADKDWDYMRQMYPSAARKIQKEIEDECDKLEYDGSCMFDEYPDRVYIGRIADRVYDRVKYLEDEILTTESVTTPDDSEHDNKSVETSQFGPEGRFGGFDRDRRHDHRDDRHRGRRNNFLGNLIDVILFNEILNRRRRFRSRRRWF